MQGRTKSDITSIFTAREGCVAEAMVNYETPRMDEEHRIENVFPGSEGDAEG